MKLGLSHTYFLSLLNQDGCKCGLCSRHHSVFLRFRVIFLDVGHAAKRTPGGVEIGCESPSLPSLRCLRHYPDHDRELCCTTLSSECAIAASALSLACLTPHARRRHSCYPTTLVQPRNARLMPGVNYGPESPGKVLNKLNKRQDIRPVGTPYLCRV